MSDFLPLKELSKHFHHGEKTLKRLHRERGLPLFRLAENGPLCGFVSEVETWLKQHRDNIVSSSRT